jgi:hypothetical protein
MKTIGPEILKELGLESLPKEEKLEILESFNQLVQREVMLYLMKKLSDRDKDELERIMDQGKNPLNFLIKKFPNLDKIWDQQIEKIKKEIKKEFKKGGIK